MTEGIRAGLTGDVGVLGPEGPFPEPGGVAIFGEADAQRSRYSWMTGSPVVDLGADFHQRGVDGQDFGGDGEDFVRTVAFLVANLPMASRAISSSSPACGPLAAASAARLSPGG